MAFLTSLLGYLGKLILYVILGVLGIFAGKKLSDRKLAKKAMEQPNEKQKNE